MSKAWTFLKKYPLLVVFFVFMVVMYGLDMYASRKDFSELENRKLKQRPAFSWASLASNEYTKKYEDYINDQFVFRDQWITLKSVGEILMGKVENNGVAFGADNYLFGVKTTLEMEQMEKNLGYLNKFTQGYKGAVTFSIIPNGYEMMPERLPTGLEHLQIKQQQVIDQLYSQAGGSRVKVLPIIPYKTMYYKTDHHWETENAWETYSSFCKSRGLDYVALSDIEALRREEEGFYGTYQNKAKRVGQPADTLVWYDIPAASVTINGQSYLTDADNNKIPVEGMFQKEKLQTRDKYAMFLYGNNGLTVIKSDNNLNKKEGKTSRLLLIKDSYANCMVPFLTYSYDEIYVVDLRGLPQRLSTLLAQTQFDDLWVLYNFESFESDRNFARLIL